MPFLDGPGSYRLISNLKERFAAIAHTHSGATPSAAGFMSAADKDKLDGIADGAETGTVTRVSTGAGLTGGDITESGTVKADLKDETESELEAASMGSTASRQYAVGLDRNGDLSVNVPWTDTEYSAGTGLSLSGTTVNHSNSVAAGTAGTSSATSGPALEVPYVAYDEQGHVTASGTHTHTVSGFAPSDHGHSVATTSAAGYMSAGDKALLDGLAPGLTDTDVDAAVDAAFAE